MGGGDLNLKKSWHPSTFANLKKVWEAEQAATKEQQKLDQLRKEKESEREAEELRRLQEKAGLISKRPERVEWMYSSSTTTAASAISEDYLLGNRRLDKVSPSESQHLSQKSHTFISPFPTTNTASSETLSRELETKMREDPLFTIKKKEVEIAKEIANNPIKRARYLKNEPDRTAKLHFRDGEKDGRDHRQYRPHNKKDDDVGRHYKDRGYHHRLRRDRSRSPRRK